CSSMGKTAEITITEHNFSAEAANVTLYKKSPGSDHNTNGMSKIPASDWTHEGDVHTLKIPFEENDDGVYYIKVSPRDLASNPTESQETAVFEIDFKNPVITSRNGNNAENKYENLEIYSEKTGIEEGFIPSVEFDDKNFDHLEYEITVYTPEYTNARELGEIVPDTDEGKTEEKVYSLPEFTKDGVYSADVVAVDKAGNESTLCRNTSVLMMNTDVLAYISNSSKSAQTGWYSLQKDENTPISKRPDSFSNLEITVFAREDSDTRIILRNANGESKDTGITAENSDDMYGMAVYNYVLPKEYFVDNYPDGTNEDIYLWAENTADGETSHTSLGWIRLDSLAPDCDVPDNLKSWKSFTGSTKTFTLSGISESLDKSKCMVYDNGNAVPAEKIQYSDENHSLSYTLEKGWHDLSFVLVDEAGNIFTVQEVSSVQVGLLYCLWFRILLGVIGAAGIAALVIFLVKKKSKRYL
ncbi:MAG: Ig-like domain repeat protein, partial [Clostridia bacterium]|nr:Ig-like domain repeat protein [Clostridia bacterium]